MHVNGVEVAVTAALPLKQRREQIERKNRLIVWVEDLDRVVAHRRPLQHLEHVVRNRAAQTLAADATETARSGVLFGRGARTVLLCRDVDGDVDFAHRHAVHADLDIAAAGYLPVRREETRLRIDGAEVWVAQGPFDVGGTGAGNGELNRIRRRTVGIDDNIRI